MNIPGCDLCGKPHTVKDCVLFSNNKKDNESYQDFQSSMSLAFQTLPNWISVVENKKKMLTVREIEKSTKFGPVLGPHCSVPKKNTAFPLCIQISDVRLWIDQTDENNSNWLSLVPVSSQNHNLVACQIDENIYYIAVKDIKISEELSVWYAPFYKTKLPSEVLEDTLSLQNTTKSDKEPDVKTISKTESETTAVSLTCRSDLQNSSIFTNSLPFLNEMPILENIYIANSGTVTSLGIDSSALQSLSVNKAFSSINLSSTAVLTHTLRSVGSNQSLIFFSAPFQSINLEPNYNSFPFGSSKSDLNIIQNTSTFNLSEQDRSGSLILDRGRDVSDIIITGDGKLRLENDPIKKKELLPNKEPNLNNLQSITVNNKELILTYKYNIASNVHNERTSEERSCNSIEKSTKSSVRKIIIKTEDKRKQKRTKSLNISSLNTCASIQVTEAEKVHDASSEYDIITLNVSENQDDSTNILTSKILRRSKVESCSPLPGIKGKVNAQLNDFVGDRSIQPWICSECVETNFSSKFSFVSHLKSHLAAYLKRKFLCQLCGLKFKLLDDFNRHSKTHSKANDSNDGIVQDNELDCHVRKINAVEENQENKNRGWKGHFLCQICLRKFNSAKFLLKHLSKHTGEFYCSLCKKEFTRRENFKLHLCVHRTENPWKCRLCRKRFTNQRSFELHALEHNEKVKCISCCQIFLSESNLNYHQSRCRKEISSTELLRFACHICSRSFSSLVFLQDHVSFCEQLEDVNKIGEVNCDQCGFLCKNPIELRIHLQKHTNPYICVHCSQRFRSRGTYERHICGMEFTCDLCNVTLTSLQELFKHITLHGPPPSCCLRCRFPYYKIDNLKLHQCKLELEGSKSEEGNKNKVHCYFCPSLFVSEHNLKKHMASLHDIPVQQKFNCGKCGKNFHRSDLLKNHEYVHSKPSFQCLECPKKFRSKKSFALHNSFHKGDFRFSCKVCSKGFTQKKYLLRHEKNHKDP